MKQEMEDMKQKLNLCGYLMNLPSQPELQPINTHDIQPLYHSALNQNVLDHQSSQSPHSNVAVPQIQPIHTPGMQPVNRIDLVFDNCTEIDIAQVLADKTRQQKELHQSSQPSHSNVAVSQLQPIHTPGMQPENHIDLSQSLVFDSRTETFIAQELVDKTRQQEELHQSSQPSHSNVAVSQLQPIHTPGMQPENHIDLLQSLVFDSCTETFIAQELVDKTRQQKELHQSSQPSHSNVAVSQLQPIHTPGMQPENHIDLLQSLVFDSCTETFIAQELVDKTRQQKELHQSSQPSHSNVAVSQLQPIHTPGMQPENHIDLLQSLVFDSCTETFIAQELVDKTRQQKELHQSSQPSHSNVAVSQLQPIHTPGMQPENHIDLLQSLIFDSCTETFIAQELVDKTRQQKELHQSSQPPHSNVAVSQLQPIHTPGMQPVNPFDLLQSLVFDSCTETFIAQELADKTRQQKELHQRSLFVKESEHTPDTQHVNPSVLNQNPICDPQRSLSMLQSKHTPDTHHVKLSVLDQYRVSNNRTDEGITQLLSDKTRLNEELHQKPGTKCIDNARLIYTVKQNEETINQYKGMVLKLEIEKQHLEEDLDLLDRRNGDLIKKHDLTKAKYESQILQLKEELEKAKASAKNEDSNVFVNHFHAPTTIVPCISKETALQFGNQGVMIKNAEQVQQYLLPTGN